ncbi:hypothetical protein F0P96_16860 [Hymenobacter busanensis]|uniref:Uncharacterized protein n=1 Tax=Hymenobacter busanensis TaxID=2607656 RepID=A0A7L4ZSX1_9BACT|nr:hypothetical protein [Hymenobacter busanensis]KAA9327647.1 hypothetical protein F0P96_16860 [Hymenobacter busanensis]QHJ06013.1 hypothetical protein GUY19_01370 [Hymenobacter busanensis]
MTDAYLRSLGFAPTQREQFGARPAFDTAWSYQHDHRAKDGALLFIEHPLGVAQCRLSTEVAPLAATDVFATTSLHDRPALEAAIGQFYAAHGGIGEAEPPFVPFVFRPFRRKQ